MMINRRDLPTRKARKRVDTGRNEPFTTYDFVGGGVVNLRDKSRYVPKIKGIGRPNYKARALRPGGYAEGGLVTRGDGCCMRGHTKGKIT